LGCFIIPASMTGEPPIIPTRRDRNAISVAIPESYTPVGICSGSRTPRQCIPVFERRMSADMPGQLMGRSGQLPEIVAKRDLSSTAAQLPASNGSRRLRSADLSPSHEGPPTSPAGVANVQILFGLPDFNN
jgi:hypothetical protein